MSRLIIFIFLGLHAVTESYSETTNISDLDLNNFSDSNHSFESGDGSLKALSAKATKTIDCLGLGSKVAKFFDRWFAKTDERANEKKIKFFLSSRNQRYRVRVMPGSLLGLEEADFKIERRTVFIVHGFLSHSDKGWVREMEDAFLLWVSILYDY